MPRNKVKGPAGVGAPTGPEKIEQESLPLNFKNNPKAPRFQAEHLDESIPSPFIPIGVPVLRVVEELASKLRLHLRGLRLIWVDSSAARLSIETRGGRAR
jgi:hypothetical protein